MNDHTATGRALLGRRALLGIGAAAATASVMGTGLPASAAPAASARPGRARAAVTATFAEDTTTVLRNPLTGWVLYSTAAPADDYWEHYDAMTVPGSDEPVAVSEYASTLYMRIAWSLLNPEEGVYGWDVDETVTSMIENARARDMRLAFRVVVDSRDKPSSFSPQYVRDAGAQGYETQTGSTTVWSPYPDDPVFQEKYAAFLAAFGERFDDPDEVEFIDGYGLGKWGEGHSVLYLDEANREAVFRWSVDLYNQHFTRVPLAVNYHRMIGSGTDWGAADPGSKALLEYAYESGWLLRHDAFGMTDYYAQWEKDFAAEWNDRRPILLEGGWVTGSHSWQNDPRGYETVADVRHGEYDDATEARVNTMDLRVGETDSWFEEGTFDLVTGFIAEGGYRLHPDEVSVPSALRCGEVATISHRWNNTGWGICPNDIPAWGFKYAVGFALLDRSSRGVVKTFVDTGAEPSGWRKDAPTSYTSSPTVTGVRPGRYTWAVAIVDTTKDDAPGLRLAVDGEVTDDGWLVLGDVEVS